VTRTALAFSVISLAPVPLLGLAAAYGGGWGWIALIYLTLFAFAMDHFLPKLIETASGADEFPASDALSVAIALAHFVTLIFVIVRFGQDMPLPEAVALYLAAGLFFGQISNANAHELIHRDAPLLRFLGKITFISLLFGHHVSAHRLVHHRYCASDRDPNSARLGESYYRFALRAWIGSFRAGLREENKLRANRGSGLHPYAIYVGGAVACVICAYLLGGLRGALVYLGLCGYAQSQLLMSDYVQHYGLRRRTLKNGRLEPVGPHHSWNAPHVFSAHMVLNAPLHSDHHIHPTRPFPELAVPSRDMAPTLPHSLPAMSVLALAPPLWRRVMDSRAQHWQDRSANWGAG
jgi:alkane 1-monooxygenase